MWTFLDMDKLVKAREEENSEDMRELGNNTSS